MSGDMDSPAASGQLNGSAAPVNGHKAQRNPYETDPERIPNNDPYISRSVHYGRYAPNDDDFTPRYSKWHGSDPQVTSYWEDMVKKSCIPENTLHMPGPREAYATGSIIIRVDREDAVGAAAERYSCLNTNELVSARKAEQRLKEIGISVPVIYFCGTIEGKNVTVESRIPGVSLEVAWRYLTAEQIDMIKKQCRHVLQCLSSLESAPESPSYVHSELNSQVQPEIHSREKELLFDGKGEAENLFFAHNDMVRSNVIVKNNHIVGILGWRQSGFFGFERSKKVHQQFRVPEQTSIKGTEDNKDDSQTWIDLYDHGLGGTASGPKVKSEPSSTGLDEYSSNEDTEIKSALNQLDGADLPEEHPTPKKISDLKHGLASRASSSDRSSPANSTKPASSNRKSVSGATKKGTAKKPPTKKRKANDQDVDSVDGRRSNTPSSVRGGKAAKSKKQGSASVAGSPAPEPKKKGAKAKAVKEEEEEDDDDDDDDGSIFCICRKPDNHTWMIGCDGGCEDWFHGKCVNIDPRDADLIDKYICPHCKEQGKGWTTWKPMCRLPSCRKPARVIRKNPSKYCSDDHGREFMRQMAQHFNLGSMASRKPTPAGRTPGSVELDPTDGSRAANTPTSNTGEEVETPGGTQEEKPLEDIGSRGGVLTAGELKAVIMEVSSVEEFRRLGERIISPPPEEETGQSEANGSGGKKLGLDIDAKDLTYSADEASKIEKLRKQRDELLHRKDMLAAREAFLPLLRQRSKSIVERLKQTDPKGGWKDICGFDSRLAWSDEEFDEWRLSKAGKKALEDGTPEALATSYPDPEATDADGDTAMDGTKTDEGDFARGVCTKKRCERHKQWLKVHQQENKFEQDTLEADLTRCEEEAQVVVERAVLRMWAEKDNAHVGGGF